MNDLAAAARYLQDLLPDMVGELAPLPSSKAHGLPHFLASLFRLAEIDLLGHRVLLAIVPAHTEPLPPLRLIAQVANGSSLLRQTRWIGHGFCYLD